MFHFATGACVKNNVWLIARVQHFSAFIIIIAPVLILSGPDDQLVGVGDNVTMMCEFLSINDFNVTWYFENEIINDFEIITSENNSILYLYEVDETDTGNYTCIVDNNILDPSNATGELSVG